MRLLLAWIYRNRDQLEDPLGLVEGLYADFGYPDEIRNLIRYNPPSDGSQPWDMKPEERTQHFFNRWRSYLETIWSSEKA